jgi:DNA-binding SARP family transcriptional activator
MEPDRHAMQNNMGAASTQPDQSGSPRPTGMSVYGAECTNPAVIQLLDESTASRRRGDIAVALRLTQQAFQLARARGEAAEIAATLVSLGCNHFRFGNYREALALADETLTFAAPYSRARGGALDLRALCAAQANDPATAEEFFRLALDLNRQIGFRHGLVSVLHNLADHIYLPRGQFALALASEEGSYRLAVELGDPGSGKSALMTIARVCWITGDRAQARWALDELSRFAEPTSTLLGTHQLLAAHLAMDEEEHAPVPGLLHQARSIAEVSGEPRLNILLRLAMSRWYRVIGDPAAARVWSEEAVTFARRVGHRYMEGQALIERAQADWGASSPQAAETDLKVAIEVLAPLGAAYDLAYAVLLMAALHQQEGRPEAEATWLDASQRISLGGYAFVLEREHPRAFPLLATHLRSRRFDVKSAAENLLEQLARVPPLPLHVVGLGSFDVRQGSRRISDHVWERYKAGELFRLLLLQPRNTATRDMIIQALWKNVPPATAEALFRQATSSLRRILEPGLPEKIPSRYLQVVAERTNLQLPPGSTVDFEQLTNQLTQAISTQNLQSLTEALAVYPDELFPLDRHADWAAPRREYLTQLELRGLLALGKLYLEANQPQEALEVCRRLLARDPWQEDAVLIAMRACQGLNDRAGALRLYRDLEHGLRQDLHLSPRADLKALAEALK